MTFPSVSFPEKGVTDKIAKHCVFATLPNPRFRTNRVRIDQMIVTYAKTSNTKANTVAILSCRQNNETVSQPLKILNIVGARPNLPKIAPLIREMRCHREVEPILVHTGQHYDEKLSDIFFRQMGIPTPNVNLGVGSGSHAFQTAEVLKRIEPVLMEYKPDVVVVVGDVNSTIATALAAVKLGIQVAHVEAGLRSFDRSMPEEINRLLTDALSSHLFVTEEDAIENLLREGRPREAIHFVGNVMIDSLQHFLPIAQQSRIGDDLGLKNDQGWVRFAVLTLHRPSNVDALEKLTDLLSAIDSVAKEVPVIFPVHPRTKQRLSEAGITHDPNLRLIPPAGYLDFLCLLSKAALVLTDSGGIQEETTALGVPCLTLRENTERPITITEGTNLLVGTDPVSIVAAAKRSLAGGKTGRTPRLWDGHAAKRIVDILMREVPRTRSVATKVIDSTRCSPAK
jgi:UDP-N-acetylglucosamine 2-epimerase (non-hydrolysing)